MFVDVLPHSEAILVEGSIVVLTAETGNPIYDFRFSQYFRCGSVKTSQSVIARIGAIQNYDASFEGLSEEGLRLIHSPADYRKCTELPSWYPLLEDLTPKSFVFPEPPSVEDVTSCCKWPVFAKGVRQTSRHRRSLAILDGPEAFRKAMEVYRTDPILRWQAVVCREYVPLRPVESPAGDMIPSSFEFRTFWWKQELVGFGRYWWQAKVYRIDEAERRRAVEVAQEAARRINVVFLVVDVAQTAQGNWIVIECNDGQESGYAGILPVAMWQRIIEIEKREPRPAV